jgi:hypothetical protein
MSPALTPALPLVPPKLGAVRARRDGISEKLATGVTVLTATIAVFLVAAAAVAFTIT